MWANAGMKRERNIRSKVTCPLNIPEKLLSLSYIGDLLDELKVSITR
jgi:hypothetical protein